MRENREKQNRENNENKILELYIHIPFCVKKCNYCDFLSAPCTREVQAAYMGALFSEIEGRAEEYSMYTVATVFIGGGTPSILEAHWIDKLMDKIRTAFTVVPDAEITIEVNPGTADEGKLRSYYASGINRLSIGLQSAEDEELRMLGRIHTWQQFLETYEAARRIGFTNINVDIMSALPGQTMDSYRGTLQKVLQLTPPPEHISAYSLIVEEGTPFARWEAEGQLDLPDEDVERQMYEETKQILGEAGFHRYEISNYATEGYECRHNCGYWKRTDYVGFGIGAASLVENVRFQNGDDLQQYINAPLGCRGGEQTLSTREQMEETMFLGLRMTEGVSAEGFSETFGTTLEEVFGEVIRKNMEDGLLLYHEKTAVLEKTLALTDKGLDISNYVMAQFL